MSRYRSLQAALALLIALAALAGASSSVTPAAAATMTVSTCNTASLDQAIANAVSGDTITFACNGTISLNTGRAYRYLIDKDLTIDGTGHDVTLDAGLESAMFYLRGDFTFTLKGLTFTQGLGLTGRFCDGCPTIDLGGVVTQDFGTLNISNSTFSNNLSTGTIGGGAIMSSLGTVNVSNSTFSSNTAWSDGGAILSLVGTLNISDSTFSNNLVRGNGGSLAMHAGTATISGSTFNGNVATAWSAQGSGGAIWGTDTTTTTVINSTFSGNRAEVGGAISNSGTLNVIHSTLSGNYAEFWGNGIANGIRDRANLLGGGMTTLSNTLLANAGVLARGDDGYFNFGANCSGPGFFINRGGSVDDDGTCSQFQISTADLRLGQLADNGGPTQTVALLPGSEVINAVTCLASVTTDQRGGVRPAAGLVACDIGAYEAGAVIPRKTTTLSGVSGSGAYLGNATLTAFLAVSGTGVAGKSITFTLNGTSVGSATTGSGGVATLSGVSLSGIAAGSYAGAIGASFAEDATHAGSSGSGTLTVGQATTTITLDAATLSQTDNGSPRVVTATTTPAGLSYSVSYDGSPTPPTDAGSYAVVATITDPNYAGSISGTLTVKDAPSPPDTAFVNPPSITGAAGGPFAFSSTEVGSTFQCSLDSGSFSPCTSPASFPGLTEGEHTLLVQAIDQDPLVDPTPASHTWIVDLTPPETGALTGPPGYTNQATSTHTFTATDAHGVARFQCYLQSTSSLIQDWKACTSPVSFTISIPFFTPTLFILRVRAIDVAGNVDATPSQFTWTTDDWAPVTSLDTKPPAVSSSDEATFTFSAFDNLGAAGYECKLDAADYSACSTPKTYTGLAGGSHTFVVRAVDFAGNVDDLPQRYTWVVDVDTPETSILTTPAGVSNVTTPAFTFNGSDSGGVARFECRVDGATFATCTSPRTVPVLSEGAHTFEVRAIDNAGKLDPSPAAYTWIIDTTAPDTTLLTQPAAITSSTSASFTFNGSDLHNIAAFECKLDGGGFSACASPAEYGGLSDGVHTFQVRSVDAPGNADATPASYTWTVDTTGPDTTILTMPDSLVGSPTATFTFSGTDTNAIASFECVLDDGNYADCTSPLQLTGLNDGEHTFTVRAVDDAGNSDATPASYTWTVDTIPPDTTILTMPPIVSNSAAPTFTFEGSDASGIASYECSLDGAEFSACASPVNLSSLAPGEHAFQVRAIDNAGLVDPSPTGYTWTVDLTPPNTTIDSTPAALSTNPAPAFRFSGSDTNGVARYECKLDSAEFGSCASPATLSGLSDGLHTFQMRAIDVAGNVDPSPASYTWTVDATAPVSGPTLSGSKTGDWYSDSATVTLSASDLNGVASIKYKLDAGSWQTYSAPFSVTGNGAHSVAYYAVDAAGNTEATRTIGVNIDGSAPLISINLPTSGGTYMLNTSATVSYTCSDPSGSGIASCSGSTASGAALDTSSLGSKNISVTATDRVGKTTTQTVSYTIGYPFSMLAGVKLAPQFNQATAGSSIYLKFSLGSNFGLGVVLAGYPKMQTFNCQTGAPIGSPVALPTTSGLTWVAGSYYQIVWKSQTNWAGSCRQVILAFNDGSTYTLNYHFVSFSWG